MKNKLEEFFVFRKQEEDTVYLHYTNFTSAKKTINVSVMEGAVNRSISSLELTMTDEANNNIIALEDSDMVTTAASIEVEPFSINTFKIGLANVITSIDTEINTNDITFKRGAGNTIDITSRKSKIRQVNVYNIQGKLVESIKNIDAFETSLSRLSPHDLHIIQVHAGSKVTVRKVLVSDF